MNKLHLSEEAQNDLLEIKAGQRIFPFSLTGLVCA